MSESDISRARIVWEAHNLTPDTDGVAFLTTEIAGEDIWFLAHPWVIGIVRYNPSARTVSVRIRCSNDALGFLDRYYHLRDAKQGRYTLEDAHETTERLRVRLRAIAERRNPDPVLFPEFPGKAALL